MLFEINVMFGPSVCLYDWWCLMFYICVCLRNMVSNTSLSVIVSVSLEFTFLQCFIGSVLPVYLVCFLTYSQCCVCLLRSPTFWHCAIFNCLYVLRSLLWSPLRYPHNNDVQFVSIHPPPQLRVWRVMSFVCMFAYNGVWLYEIHGGCYLQALKIPPYFGEVGVAHRVNALGFLCVFIVFTLFVLYSMLPVFLDCLFLLALPVSQDGSFAIMRKSKVILLQV
jgi:hypothetical protein